MDKFIELEECGSFREAYDIFLVESFKLHILSLWLLQNSGACFKYLFEIFANIKALNMAEKLSLSIDCHPKIVEYF